MTARPELLKTRRLIVKIGSRTIANDPAFPARLARQLADLAANKCGSVVVTSGAIALGWSRLGYKSKPKEVALLQASAAAGQSVLMRQPDFAEGFVVTAHQHALPCRGRSLQQRDLFRLGLVAEPAPTERDRATRHHD